jgi:ribulose-phosphate 3-epimerase
MGDTIGKVTQRAKIASGLFWADYSVLGAQVRDLEAAGVDWFHVEVRDGKYMDFGMRAAGSISWKDCVKHDSRDEAQLQMVRPSFDVFRQLADLGVNLISLPVETTGEMTMQAITFIKDELGLKAGVWAWQGTPISAFEQYLLPFVDIIEYESRAHFWVKESGKSPHDTDPIMFENIRRMHAMIVAAGLESSMELMVDGGVNTSNVAAFIQAGMTVGEFSSPLKGPEGKFVPGTGQIEAAVKKLRAVMDEASQTYRDIDGLKMDEPKIEYSH